MRLQLCRHEVADDVDAWTHSFVMRSHGAAHRRDLDDQPTQPPRPPKSASAPTALSLAARACTGPSPARHPTWPGPVRDRGRSTEFAARTGRIVTGGPRASDGSGAMDLKRTGDLGPASENPSRAGLPPLSRRLPARRVWWELEALRGHKSADDSRRYARNMRWAAELYHSLRAGYVAGTLSAAQKPRR